MRTVATQYKERPAFCVCLCLCVSMYVCLCVCECMSVTKYCTIQLQLHHHHGELTHELNSDKKQQLYRKQLRYILWTTVNIFFIEIQTFGNIYASYKTKGNHERHRNFLFTNTWINNVSKTLAKFLYFHPVYLFFSPLGQEAI